MSGRPPFGGSPPPYGRPPYGQGPYGPPQSPYGGPGWDATARDAPGAVPALILGVLGVTLCAIAAPFAWFMGRNAQQTADAQPDRYSGRDMATAGKILGIVGTCLLALGVIAFVVFVIVGIATSSN